MHKSIAAVIKLNTAAIATASRTWVVAGPRVDPSVPSQRNLGKALRAGVRVYAQTPSFGRGGPVPALVTEAAKNNA